MDTGAGLERIAAVLQGKVSNYDTDLFRPVIAKVEELSGKQYSTGPEGTPFRVIADHIRAANEMTPGAVMSVSPRVFWAERACCISFAL